MERPGGSVGPISTTSTVPRHYPVINTLRRYGPEASAATAIGVFIAVLASTERTDGGAFLRAGILAALLGVGIKNLSELSEIIADTLIPQ